MAHLIDEMEDLIELHYAEISTHKHIKKLNPDWERFVDLEEQGISRVLTARDGDTLVGYLITFTLPHIHFKDCVMSHNDAVYLHPEYRGKNGIRFFQAAIQDLKDNTESDMLAVHMKVFAPFRKLLAHLGFKQTEENWEIEL